MYPLLNIYYYIISGWEILRGRGHEIGKNPSCQESMGGEGEKGIQLIFDGDSDSDDSEKAGPEEGVAEEPDPLFEPSMAWFVMNVNGDVAGLKQECLSPAA